MVHRLKERAMSSQRIDDNPESVRRRLDTFRNDNGPIEEHLRRIGGFERVSLRPV